MYTLEFIEAKKAKDREGMAMAFLNGTKTEFTAEFVKTDKYFPEDKCQRDIYKITLKRGKREFSFLFGQSLADSSYYKDKDTKGEYLLDGSERNCFSSRKYAQKFLDEFCFKMNGKKPSEYDVLAGLTNFDVGSFENFCLEFGYDTDSKKAEKTYQAVLKEFEMVRQLWSDKEIEILQEIN